MSWRTEKTEAGQDLVYDAVEQGIAPSPHKGTANIQNANISTEQGEVMASFGRTAQQQAAISGGTLTPDGATLFDAPSTLKAGQWISVSASTVTSISTTTTPASVSIDYLAVAGGGGSGGASTYASGGGGGGAVRTGSSSVTATSYSITVGQGGSLGSPGGNGGNGTDSVLGAIVTATGGGGGGDGNTVINGSNGGSGGGGGASNITAGTGGTASTGGNVGGSGNTTTIEAGGGGGGAGAVGASATTSTGGSGGNGTASSISGASVTYGGGGGGGAASGGSAGTGGTGGGGNGGLATTGTAGTDGLGGGAGGRGGTGIGSVGGSGVVIISYTTNSMVATGGAITKAAGKTIHTFTESGTFEVLSVVPNRYYVSYAVGGKIKLSAKYDPYCENALTHGTTGSITFSTVATPGAAIAKAIERFGTATSNEYRYYILDNSGYVWVYDTNVFDTNSTTWMLPDPNSYSSLAFTGMNVINGWLFCLSTSQIFTKPTVDLGSLFLPGSNMQLVNPFPTHINYAYTANQGKLYYTDGNFIGEVFPTTSLLTSLANIQSYSKYTASSTTGTVTALINGSLPYTQDSNGDTARIPAIFFTDVYGTAPTNLLGGTVYWIEYVYGSDAFFVYTASTGGSAINIATGAVGNQYFNTFGVFGDAGVNGANSTVQFSQQRVNLPANEVAQCIIEVGNTVIIGGKSNVLYPWNQIDATPSDFIYLPEADVKTMINVNNMAYVFAGYKGNIYISNGSVASSVLKVPDYIAGVPGTPLTYIEPVFTWFDAIYMRGRIYFSILDQTATKAGNAGGVWSFIPSQNFSFGQDTGLSLRLENQNSYGDYDGVARILIANEEQQSVAPQYWSFWQDSYSIATSTFGIDYTSGNPVTTFVVETDLLATGTLLAKNTYTQLEYKLATPLASGDSVSILYRLNATDAWLTCGTAEVETSNPISGYFNMTFQKTQWIQFRVVGTTNGTTTSSFNRLSQIRLR